MTETLLGNGIVATSQRSPRIIADGAVVWRDGRIVDVGEKAQLRRKYPSASRLDAGGGLILPGLVNLHHHFYSALARGLDPGVSMTNFPEVLDRLWWRLDRALDAETVALSAELAVADCIRWGTTTVFDHHASPSAIPGSLDTLAEVVSRAGLSALLCYEVTDRNGPDEAQAGLDENLRFIDEYRDDPRIRGAVGLHASFTLKDKTLARVAELRPKGTGCHIHVAEDPMDMEASRSLFESSPLQRLERFGLLDSHCLIAHGIHLGPAGYERIACHDAILIHNPESNANNSVGHLDTVRALAKGCLVGLGTDGMAASMLRALKSAFLLHRHATGDPSTGFVGLPDLLDNNVDAARRFFDEPLLGELSVGAPADVIVVDAPTPTPITPDNLFAHLLYGASEAPVRHTIARGRVLLEDFRHTTMDPGDIAARARAQAPDLWKRFHDLSWNTPYLGE